PDPAPPQLYTLSLHDALPISGTFDVVGDTSFLSNLGGPATINNTGSFLKSGGTGSTAIGPAFNNNGTLNVQSGTMSFYSGGDSRSEEHTSELQSRFDLVCRLL